MEPYPTYYNQPGPPAAHPPPQEPRGRGARPYTGAKRGRKPRAGGPNTAAPSTRPEPQPQSQPQPGAHAYPIQSTSRPAHQLQPQTLHYYTPQAHQSTMMPPPQYAPLPNSIAQKGKGKEDESQSVATLKFPAIPPNPSALPMRYQPQHPVPPALALGPPIARTVQMKPPVQGGAPPVQGGGGGGDDEDDAEELPVMSDDVYGQGLLWQSQSKENLKVLMDNFTPEQFERYEAYRRSALPKQSVRKAIQGSTNHTVSQPVAQVVAGFAKVFVGEIVEKARQVQAKQGEPPDTPLSPEHLREAYILYQEDTGKVGAARVHRGKKLFVR